MSVFFQSHNFLMIYCSCLVDYDGNKKKIIFLMKSEIFVEKALSWSKLLKMLTRRKSNSFSSWLRWFFGTKEEKYFLSAESRPPRGKYEEKNISSMYFWGKIKFLFYKLNAFLSKIRGPKFSLEKIRIFLKRDVFF